ncbi:MAG: hypothetical protein AB7F40_04520 [Victivallaceae bacterium]
MENKHTPGPWCSVHRNFAGIPVEYSVWQCVCDRPGDPDPQSRKICEMQTSNNAVAKRDSALIASAPEMYDMLAEVATLLEMEDGFAYKDKLEFAAEIENLLRKARGE